MDLTAEEKLKEEELKERFREIFYGALLARIEAANSPEMAHVLDTVRGDHRLLDVLYGWQTTQVEKLQIFPPRTYELIRELRAKEHADGNPDRRDQ